MRCDTCKQESQVVLQVVIDKDYNRSLARPLFNCPNCFEKKEHTKQRSGFGVRGSGQVPSTANPQPPTKGRGHVA